MIEQPSPEPGLGIQRKEFLYVADLVAKEKNIDKEIIFSTMEEAISRAARNKYGPDRDIRAKIDRKTCELTVARYMTVVEEVTDELKEISLTDALAKHGSVEVGQELVDQLPAIDFSRITAIGAKQIVLQKMREVERERQYNEFVDRKGEIISGIVKRIEYKNVIVDLGRGEGILRRDALINREILKLGDRIRCYIEDVRREQRGQQIILSRVHPQFMVKLFTQEVPEIYEGTIQIVACVRDPGSRAKMSVNTSDPSLDPIGACIGMRGSRVQAVSQELQGERVDITRWSEDPATYVVNALSPIEVTKVILDQEAKHIVVVVGEDKLSKTIGRRGQNVRLASELTGYHIEIITEAKEAERRQIESKQYMDLFMQALDTDEVIARLLVAEGFDSIEGLANTRAETLASIEGFSEDLAQEIVDRAAGWLKQKQIDTENRLQKLAVAPDLIGFCGLSNEMVLALAEQGIKTIEDLAGLSVDELVDEADGRGTLGSLGVSQDDAGGLILEARHHCGWIELPEEPAEADPEPAAAPEQPETPTQPDSAAEAASTTDAVTASDEQSTAPTSDTVKIAAEQQQESEE